MKTKGNILIGIGLLLFAAALLLTGYNVADEMRAASSVQNMVSELKIEERQNEKTTPDAQISNLSEVEIPDYQLNPQMDMPEQAVADHEYIGILEIPSLDLRLPIISDWSYPALRISPCRYEGSPYTDDLVIAAHNYRSHFGRLAQLTKGEEVRFTDLDGNVFVYKVGDITTVDPDDTADVTSGAWDLTLFTCTVGGQYRVVVRCERTNQRQ